MRVQATIRRADIAKILIKKGFVVKDIIEDPDFHWSTNFIFDVTDALQEAYDDALKQLHLTADDPNIHRGAKHNDNYDKSKRTTTSRGGYSKDTKVAASDVKTDKVADETATDVVTDDNTKVVATTATTEEVRKDA